jgi:hypothetical protein
MKICGRFAKRLIGKAIACCGMRTAAAAILGADPAARARLKRPTGVGCQGNWSWGDIEIQNVLASVGVTVEAVKEPSFSE